MSLTKKFFYIKLLILIGLQTGCFEEQSFNNYDTQKINTVEDLNEFVLSQTYTVILESGEMISFTPSEFKTYSEGINFTTAEPGFNFTDLSNPFYLQNGGGASLQIDNGDEYHFSHTLCFKISDLRAKYSGFPEEYDDFYYYLAVGVSTYSEQEIVEGEPIFIDDLLYVLQHPEGYHPYNYKGFYSKDGYHYFLQDNGSYNSTKNSFQASGSAYRSVYDYFQYYGKYILDISCY